MRSYTTPAFWKAYDRLEHTVQKQARRANRQFEENPRHPSLRFKKVHATERIYSVRIDRDHRALGVRDDGDIVWFWIGAHDEYERLFSRL